MNIECAISQLESPILNNVLLPKFAQQHFVNFNQENWNLYISICQGCSFPAIPLTELVKKKYHDTPK